MRRALVLLGLLALIGCAPDPDAEQRRERVREWLRAHLQEPPPPPVKERPPVPPPVNEPPPAPPPAPPAEPLPDLSPIFPPSPPPAPIEPAPKPKVNADPPKPKPAPKPKPQPRPKGVPSAAVCAQIALGIATIGIAGVKAEARKRGYSEAQIDWARKGCGY